MENEIEHSSLSKIEGITHPPVKLFQAQTNPDPAKIDSSAERQKNAINLLIESHLNKLSARSSNALKEYPGLNLFDDYDVSNGLPIFRIFKGLVENDLILNKQEKIIFFNEFCTAQSFKAKTLNQIGIDLGLTRERVRQIKAQLFYKFDNLFSFIQHTEIKSLVNYGFDLTGNYIEITDELVYNINLSEGTSFNPLFITKIIALLYSDKYDLIGKVNLGNPDRNKASSNWKRSYIVNKNVSAILDFNSFINDVRIRLSGKIYEWSSRKGLHKA